jgi:hypothetical protein
MSNVRSLNVLRRIFTKLFRSSRAGLPTSSPVAYGNEAANSIYNLLFCDQPELYVPRGKGDLAPWQALLFGNGASVSEIEAIAKDGNLESRIRVLAFNWLRSRGHRVPERLLLGVVVEVALASGLDTLAAYADGQVRYINQSGKIAVFDGGPPEVAHKAIALVDAAKATVARIGPWEKPRLPPPKRGNVRLTFLVSDGLYFGEGLFSVMQNEPLAAPVLSRAAELLQLSVDTVLNAPET